MELTFSLKTRANTIEEIQPIQKYQEKVKYFFLLSGPLPVFAFNILRLSCVVVHPVFYLLLMVLLFYVKHFVQHLDVVL